jgi:hypothetical protein
VAAKKKPAPKFRFPPKGKRCSKVAAKRDTFHEASFRNVKTPAVMLMVGCPKKAQGRGMKKAYSTVWLTTPSAVKTRTQCRFKAGPKKGERAGMRPHMIVKPVKAGRCAMGYKKK